MGLHQVKQCYENNKSGHNSIYCIVKSGVDMEIHDCILALARPQVGAVGDSASVSFYG